MKSYVDRRTGKYIHSRLRDAVKSVFICTPYIDEKYIGELANLSKRNVLVKLISGNRQTNFTLKEHLKKCEINHQCFQHIIASGKDFIHAKIMIIDNNYAVDGSANLTKNGLWEQVNYIHVYQGEEVRQIVDVFEKIWTYNERHLFKYESAAKPPIAD